MKTIFRILMLGFLLFPLCASAQKATGEKEYNVRIEWEEMQGYSSWASYKVPIYYDDDDNVVKHGPFKVNYKEDLTARVGKKVILTYNASGSYINGKLDGVVSIEQLISTHLGSYKTVGTLNFVNGVPYGTWTFAQTIAAGNENESYSLSVTIKDNKIVNYNKNGLGYFEINSDGTFSGRLGGEDYKNSVNISTFIRKTGEETELDETAQNLINAFIAGSMSESDLLAKGYIFEKTSWENLCNPNTLNSYVSILSATYFMKGDGVSVSIDDLIKSTKNDKNISSAHKLKRVNLMSAEDLISKAQTTKIKTAYSVTAEKDYIHWGGCTYYYNSNYVQIDNECYYFTDDVKFKFKEAIDAGLEERRLEEERKAEEERLKEEQEVRDVVANELKSIIGVSDYRNINKNLAQFCPIVGFEILDLQKESSGNYYIIICIVDKFINEKVGFQSYQTYVVCSKYRSRWIIDMSNSFNLKNTTRVENDWDRIHEMKAQIDKNKEKIFLSDVVVAYSKYHEYQQLDKIENTSKKDRNKLKEVVKTQKQCLEFIELRKQINANNDVILGYASQYKNVVKLYSAYFKTLDLSWNVAENAKEKLEEVISIQDELKQNLASEYASIFNKAVAKEKILDLKSALECFETIELRKQLDENDALIRGYAKQYKNITKIYIAYFKTLDFTWVSADASKAKFEDAIANQIVICNALKSSNAAELDAAIKQEKIKDIRGLINRLQ